MLVETHTPLAVKGSAARAEIYEEEGAYYVRYYDINGNPFNVDAENTLEEARKVVTEWTNSLEMLL